MGRCAAESAVHRGKHVSRLLNLEGKGLVSCLWHVNGRKVLTAVCGCGLQVRLFSSLAVSAPTRGLL